MSSLIQCPGCGLKLPGYKLSLADRYHASEECWGLYGELSAYYMTYGDSTFRHQHSVAAYGAQHTGEGTRKITTAFSLIGLYLAVERGYTGREVQQAHMDLSKRKIAWPSLTPPPAPYKWTVWDVWQAEPGEKRDELQRQWAADVWARWGHTHEWVKAVCAEWLKLK